MRTMLCLVRPSGAPVTEEARAAYAGRLGARRAGDADWYVDGSFAAYVSADEGGLGPSVARSGALVGVGDVRLDHRGDVERSLDRPTAALTDLELLLAAVERRGARCVADLLGDFAFVAWNAATREIVAARDAFGPKLLYYATRPDLVAFCSRPSVLSDGDALDLGFIADYLVGGVSESEPSVFGGVSTVVSGHTLTLRDGRLSLDRYWSPERFEIDESLTGSDQAERFRELFATAVASRLTGRDDVWAFLSGGLDSSSVVCMAQALAASGRIARGVAGTITHVDSLGDGDETEFVNAVTRPLGVRSERLVNYRLWQDDGAGPPLTEHPAPHYLTYARDRRMLEILRSAGARVTLGGGGADHYLFGGPMYLADWMGTGRVRDALRGTTEWAVTQRASFWRVGYEHVLRPLLPSPIRVALLPEYARVPRWIDRAFARRFRLSARRTAARIGAGPTGQKYQREIALQVSTFGSAFGRGFLPERIEARYPFLYRPLVELALRLPPRMRTRPRAEKWVLREAMRGILPELVRTRTTKGGTDGSIAWSLQHEHRLIDEMLADPVLADLGCVDARALREGVAAARQGKSPSLVPVLTALSLETWLRVRLGRWVVREGATATAVGLSPGNRTSTPGR
ncbi:MAG: asparagine synthetase B family protein [Gemmatimonadaceae bacterium]